MGIISERNLEEEGTVGRERLGKDFHQPGPLNTKFLLVMCLFLKSQASTDSDAGTTVLSWQKHLSK